MTTAGERDLDLDAVKGFLVVVMILYHTMNYFSHAPAEVYGYLRFVNGAFVLISGYVVAVFHAGGRGSANRAASRRLARRGAKLLVLFTVLNLLISFAGITNYRKVEFGVRGFFDNAMLTYGSGSTGQIAFRILVPIAYVLLLSALIVIAGRWQRSILALVFVASLLYSFVDPVAPNLFFVLTGLIGLSLGLLDGGRTAFRVDRWAWIVLGFAGLASAMNFLSGSVLAYGLGLALLLKLVYDACGLLSRSGAIHRELVLLGKYSLLCYIAQIGFLFVLHRALRGRTLAASLELPLVIIATSAFLVVGCALLERQRRRSRWVESTYRMVFA